MFEFKSLLVPVDFSSTSKAAFEQSLQLATGATPLVILLHVVDTALAEAVAGFGLASREEAVQRMRQHAEAELATFQRPEGSQAEVQTIIAEGVPFLEIMKKADEFYVDAIVMGRYGSRGPIEKLLFGTTAERVLRGSSRPVLVLPIVSAAG